MPIQLSKEGVLTGLSVCDTALGGAGIPIPDATDTFVEVDLTKSPAHVKKATVKFLAGDALEHKELPFLSHSRITNLIVKT